MKIIASPRLSGKTSKLVKLLKEDPKSYLLVWSRELREIAVQRFELPPDVAVRVLLHGEIEKLRDVPARIYIDDIEIFLVDHVRRYGKLAGFSISLSIGWADDAAEVV